MNKVIVMLNDVRMYDQFLALPPTFIVNNTEYRIVRTSDSAHRRDVSRRGHYLEFAHDLRFVYVWDQPQVPFYDLFTATVNLHRLNKGEQMERLTRIVQQMNLTHFYNLGFSVIDFSDYKIRHHIDPLWDEFVLKPTGGARSMSLIYLDKEVNFKSFITQLNQLRNKKDNPATNQDYTDLCKQFGVKFNTGQENRENEAAKTVGENTLILQERNPFGDIDEFRAIVGAEQPLLIRRTHFDYGLKGSIRDEVITSGNYDKYFSQDLYEEIMLFLQTGNLLPHGSIDIWHSKKDSRWGIYEYQCQFGHVYIDEPLLTNYLKSVIVHQHELVRDRTL